MRLKRRIGFLIGLDGEVPRLEIRRREMLGIRQRRPGQEIFGAFRHVRDHHRYTAADIAGLTKEADALKCEWIVTTEKDIIKIKHLDLPENILIIRIEFSVDSSFYDRVFE